MFDFLKLYITLNDMNHIRKVYLNNEPDSLRNNSLLNSIPCM